MKAKQTLELCVYKVKQRRGGEGGRIDENQKAHSSAYKSGAHSLRARG